MGNLIPRNGYYHNPDMGRVNEKGVPISSDGTMDFSKSVMDPKSRLWRAVVYLRQMGSPVTRKQIINEAWNQYPKRYEGYSGCWFSLARRQGYIKMFRKGNKVYYVLGDNPNIEFIVFLFFHC